MTDDYDAAAAKRTCDEYLNDPTTPEVLRTYLTFARSPAHGLFASTPQPVLYATYKGKRVRVTMASRLGDVGITELLTAKHGYDFRVFLEDLTDFGDAP